jgi:RNA polymerase sigma-70 factor (ECF subfamily)
MFNEGYNSTHSDELIRKDVIAQAMILCKFLTENPRTQLPEAYALMALMCFHSARADTRLTPEGELILLTAQDRSQWNTELIHLGNTHLNKAASGNVLTMYHLEAAIAYEHCTASSYENTNWKSILQYYDALVALSAENDIVLLNRCIVIMELYGPQKALATLKEFPDNKRVSGYYLFHAVLGELYHRTGDNAQALRSFENARQLTQSGHEKRFLTHKILHLQMQ